MKTSQLTWVAPHILEELRTWERRQRRERAINAALGILGLAAVVMVLLVLCGEVTL